MLPSICNYQFRRLNTAHVDIQLCLLFNMKLTSVKWKNNTSCLLLVLSSTWFGRQWLGWTTLHVLTITLQKIVYWRACSFDDRDTTDLEREGLDSDIPLVSTISFLITIASPGVQRGRITFGVFTPTLIDSEGVLWVVAAVVVIPFLSSTIRCDCFGNIFNGSRSVVVSLHLRVPFCNKTNKCLAAMLFMKFNSREYIRDGTAVAMICDCSLLTYCAGFFS